MKDLKYLMSYSIALTAFVGISLGGFYNYLAVVFTFIFIPILETIVKKSDEEYTEEEKKELKAQMDRIDWAATAARDKKRYL